MAVNSNYPEWYTYKYPTNYRLVVARSFYSAVKGGTTKEKLETHLREMQCFLEKCLKNERPPKNLYFNGFLELFSFDFQDQIGAVLVDRTGACPPLILYPTKQIDMGDKGPRLKAASYAMKDTVHLAEQWYEFAKNSDSEQVFRDKVIEQFGASEAA